ncbi:MAG TPA: glycosyltransferase family 4 protein [Bacteroidia bacterium]|nr:glycosyltransferase family 4 protein [Bacteroidia bacterium]
MKKILVVTYYWPPSGGPGVQRWLKFVKYLRRSGFGAVVVTVDPEKASYPVFDHSLEKEIPEGTEVHRTNSFEPLRIFSSFFKKEKVPYAGIPDRDKMSLAGKISLYIRANFFIPDARKGWNRYAFRECCRIIEQEKITAVITSSPPHSTQLTGLRLKQKYGIRWIADLRDPWTDIYYYHKLHHSERAKRKDLAYELSVLENADHILVTSNRTAKQYSAKSAAVAGKIHVIPNGFDEDDFQTEAPASPGKFTVTFIGTINEQFGIGKFVAAVKNAQRSLPSVPFEVKFVGQTDRAVENLLRSELGEMLVMPGYVSHKESVEEMRKAQLLLLVIPQGPNQGTVPGKTFEYLAAQRSIICLAPEGSSAADIIRSCEAGRSFVHDDQKGMEEYIVSLAKEWQAKGDLKINNGNFRQYSRRSQAEILAGLISGATPKT